MLGIIKALGGLTALGIFVIKEMAVRWGYKVALVAAVVSVYLAAWAAIGSALVFVALWMPSGNFTSAMAQFFPAKSAVISGAAMYFGTMATLKSWDYFRMAAGVAAKIGS
ncbi:unnamed protein product [Rotaria socialis]